LRILAGNVSISENEASHPSGDPLSDSQQEEDDPVDQVTDAQRPPELDHVEADDASGGTPSAPEPSHVDKWQLLLNATQVFIGLIALVGFLALVKFQIVDHFDNNASLELAKWEAWKDFRDECRTMLVRAMFCYLC
jgi:hypothetical protein